MHRRTARVARAPPLAASRMRPPRPSADLLPPLRRSLAPRARRRADGRPPPPRTTSVMMASVPCSIPLVATPSVASGADQAPRARPRCADMPTARRRSPTRPPEPPRQRLESPLTPSTAQIPQGSARSRGVRRSLQRHRVREPKPHRVPVVGEEIRQRRPPCASTDHGAAGHRTPETPAIGMLSRVGSFPLAAPQVLGSLPWRSRVNVRRGASARRTPRSPLTSRTPGAGRGAAAGRSGARWRRPVRRPRRNASP